jgi:gluconokinase
MGVAGSGKSTVGAALAQRLAVPFADADDFHSEQAKAKMAAGHPLDDADRAPWLERLASWLHDEPLGCVLACSGLRRWYRDALRTGAPGLCFLHLVGDPSVMTGRVAGRQQHYMPASLVLSQYETLEPLGPDEFGVAIDCTLTPEQIVEQFLREVR